MRRIPRFAFLTISFLALVILLAAVEALVIRLRCPHLVERSLVETVWIGDLAISSDGQWAVSRSTFSTGTNRGMVHDVVLCNLVAQNAVRLHIQRYGPQYVAVSPVSDDIAISCADGSIRVASGWLTDKASRSLSSEPLRTFAETSDFLTHPTFSPDGRLLAAKGLCSVYVWQWPSGELLQRRPHDAIKHRRLSFSSDSRHLLSPRKKGEASLWDTNTGEDVAVISLDQDYEISSAVLSPDAEFAAIQAYPSGVGLFRLASGEELWSVNPLVSIEPSIAYSPDGRFLAIAGSDRGTTKIVVVDAMNGKTLGKLVGHDAGISTLAFGPNGVLYSGDRKGVIRSWDLEAQRERWHLSVLY